ncbi:MAG TPA: DUF58 domain-containing protein [Armatimonadota bacterium]|nr:DUF58 domain-containing protein [Armatimonadota bacterium]
MRPSVLALVWMAVGGLCLLAAPVWPVLLWLGIGVDGLLALLLVTDLFLLRQAEALTARREHEEILSLGAPNLVTLVVENPTAFPFRLALRDATPDQAEADRAQAAGTVPPFGQLTASYHLTPLQRGAYPFGPLTVRVKTPLGLWVGQYVYAHGDTMRVYPNIQQTKQQHLLTRQQRTRQMGLRAMRLRGQGMEFESLRDYLPDDELRRVDWKASARRGNLVTREYDIERSQQIMIVLDLGRAMASHLDYMTKLDHAINAAVLLTYVAGQSQDRVGVMAFADTIAAFMPPGKGAGQLPLVLDQLYPLQPRQVEPDYRGAFTHLAHHVRKRSLIIIFTDLIDPDSSKRLMDSLALLHPQHLVLCVALSDYELRGIVTGMPANQTGLYQQAVAVSVMEDRQLALATLHRRGILTVDAAPSDLAVAVVNRYLAVKREGRV